MLAVIYSNGNQESERAISLFETLDAQILKYKLDKEFTQFETTTSIELHRHKD